MFRYIVLWLIVCLTPTIVLAGGESNDTSGVVAFVWTSDSGTVSFTDDEKRIPERYKKQARQLVLGDLKDYERFTIVEEDANKSKCFEATE